MTTLSRHPLAIAAVLLSLATAADAFGAAQRTFAASTVGPLGLR
jgi:hypothetical protein